MKILAAEWVLPISADPIQDGGVLVDGDRIAAVGPAKALKTEYSKAPVDDFGEAVIMPGFVNCHSHLEITLMRGYLDAFEDDFFTWLITLAKTRDEILTPQDIELSALLGALEGARAGVTCFGDIGKHGAAGFKALKAAGLRGIVFQETVFSPHNEKAVEEFKKLNEKFVGLRSEETDLIEAGLSPHAPYTVSSKLFELIADLSLRDDVKLSIHTAESRMEQDLMISGSGKFADLYHNREIKFMTPAKSSVQYLKELGVLQAKPLLVHCVFVDADDIATISESGASVAHCPKSNAKFGHGSAPLENFLNSKVSVGLGSDSMVSNNTCDMIEEARFAALTARNIRGTANLFSARTAIEMATLGGAKAMGLDDRIGTLEVGKDADLVAISLKGIHQQPIHDIHASILFASSASDIVMTMVAGKEVYRDGQVQNIDEIELKAEVKKITNKMKR